MRRIGSIGASFLETPKTNLSVLLLKCASNTSRRVRGVKFLSQQLDENPAHFIYFIWYMTHYKRPCQPIILKKYLPFSGLPPPPHLRPLAIPQKGRKGSVPLLGVESLLSFLSLPILLRGVANVLPKGDVFST